MIFEKIRSIIAEQLDLDEETITMDSDCVEDLGADSLDMVDLVFIAGISAHILFRHCFVLRIV